MAALGKLQDIKDAIEQHWEDMQDVEYTISHTVSEPEVILQELRAVNLKLYNAVDEADKVWQNQK